MNDRLAHPGVRQSWKSLRDPKIVSNSPRNGPESAKTSTVDDRHVSAPEFRQSWKSLRDPKTVSNSPRNGPESAKIVSVDERHVSAPRGSSIVEITPGPQNSE